MKQKITSLVVTKDDYTKLPKNVGALQDTLMAFRKNMALDAIAPPQKKHWCPHHFHETNAFSIPTLFPCFNKYVTSCKFQPTPENQIS